MKKILLRLRRTGGYQVTIWKGVTENKIPDNRVIDSLSALLAACQERLDYRTLMHLFYIILKNHCGTMTVTCSIPTGQKTIGLN